jgi:CubicO group peptidase (beta-lactamase class C family)
VRDLNHVADIVVTRMAAAPAAVAAAAARSGARWELGLGAAGGATTDTPFDLASLTKPLTALTLARLERAKVLSRTELLGALLGELSATRSASIPLDLLAAHRAGLDAHRELFAPMVQGGRIDRAAALLEAADARRADCAGEPSAEGFPSVYSDLGYLLLGEAMSRRTGLDLDRLVEREVVAPLGLRIGSARWWRSAHPQLFAEVAPTEEVAWRGGLIRGITHDENAWAMAADASAGHAGLFGDAISVARLGAAVLDALADRAPDWLGAADLEPVLRPRPGGSYVAGFDRRTAVNPSSGSRFGPRTFGHLGFTGTSLWIDPDAELVGVLLTNRVHPTRATDVIKRARPAAYDALFEAMRVNPAPPG